MNGTTEERGRVKDEPAAPIARWLDALLAAIGDWLDGPSRTPLPDPGASRRRN